MNYSKLEEFLAIPDVSELTTEVEISLNGKPLTIVCAAMDSDQYEAYQKAGRVKGKNLQFDYRKYRSALVCGQIVSPDFQNTEFLNKSGCATMSEFIDKKFPVGVIDRIADEVSRLSGFKTTDDKVEEAKNS